jgi:hypothetical protein
LEDRPVLKGLLAGGITLGFAAGFPESLVFPLLTVVMALMAGTFPGMAMADQANGRPSLEWFVALSLMFMALAGLWGSPVFLACAFLVHSSWSFLHRVTALGDGTPEGYPAFCFTYDLVMAGFVTYIWSVGV